MGGPRWIRVVNYEGFQHYKNRSPVWIKLKAEFLRRYDFHQLTEPQRLHLIMIWLLASQMKNRIPYDEKWIAEQIGVKKVELEPLIGGGWLEIDTQLELPGTLEPEEDLLASGQKADLLASGQKADLLASGQKADLLAQKRVEEELHVGTARAQGVDFSTDQQRPVNLLFEHWNSQEHLTTHRALNSKAAQSISARLSEGYSLDDLKRAIVRYNELVSLRCAPGFNQWGLAELMSRGSGSWIDKLLSKAYNGTSPAHGASGPELAAWTEVEGAIHAHGPEASVRFVDATTNAVIINMGGWPWICYNLNSHVSRDFKERYRLFSREGKTVDTHLPGRRELEGRIEETVLVGGSL